MITEGQVLDIAKDAIYYIIICSAPIVAVFIGLMVCGSWILNQLSEFVTTLWSNFSIYLG